MSSEDERTRLIGEIACLLRGESVPDEARSAGLTLIGWLARRMPGETPCQHGVEEMHHRAKLHAARRLNGVRRRAR